MRNHPDCLLSIRRLFGRKPTTKAQPAINPGDQWGKVFEPGQKTLVELDDFGLYVMPDDYVGSAIAANKTYEPHVTKVLRRELRSDDVFLDIGANVGFFTMLAWSMLKKTGKVISVEPNPANVRLIHASIEHNAARNVFVHPYAAGNSAGSLRFANIGSNGLVVTDQCPEQRHFFLVQSVALDDLLNDEEKISFVKMDIEAYEPFALVGMTKLMKRHRPKLLTEFHPWAMKHYNRLEPADYLHHILSFGYELSIIDPAGELVATSSAEDIMVYYASLGEETRHLDLFARPLPLQ
jgi:FkbM family methyltransferase